MAVRVLQVDNTYKKWKQSMKKYGFVDEQLKVAETVETSLMAEQQVIQNAVYQTTKNRVTRWGNKLKRLLSTPIPIKYMHKKRPALRKLPYMVSGAMANSLEVDLVRTKKRASWVYTMTIQVDGFSDHTTEQSHAEHTNLGHKSTRNVRWEHWTDNVLGDTPHTAKIVSAGILMREYLFKPVSL